MPRCPHCLPKRHIRPSLLASCFRCSQAVRRCICRSAILQGSFWRSVSLQAQVVDTGGDHFFDRIEIGTQSWRNIIESFRNALGISFVVRFFRSIEGICSYCSTSLLRIDRPSATRSRQSLKLGASPARRRRISSRIGR